MPALEITRSMLVNRGLSAINSVEASFVAPDAGMEISNDNALGAFRKIIADDVLAAADHNLVGIFTAFTSPLELATYLINAKYDELGGSTGVLGGTTSAVVATSNNVGFMRNFQRGVIYWHPNVGAHGIHGPIRVRWQELNAEKGFLGFPTSDVTAGSDVRAEGFFAHFQGGSIYWTQPARIVDVAGGLAGSVLTAHTLATDVHAAPTAHGLSTPLGAHAISDAQLHVGDRVSAAGVGNGALAHGFDAAVRTDVHAGIGGAVREVLVSSAGAFEVHGAIREKYLALGAEASILGYPVTDETATPDRVGRFNHFQGGSIYWTPGTYAHEVHGLIRERWASQGWERNPQLGYPITDELTPDPRIGHRRPEVRKKPILSLPSDVIKLPADAAVAGFPASVVNTPSLGIAGARVVSGPPASVLAASSRATPLAGAIGRLSDRPLVAATAATPAGSVVTSRPDATHLDPGHLGVFLTPTAASTPAEKRSVNRFADFENGLLFWFRGATAATTLTPLASTSDGTDLSFSGADIANAALAKIGRSNFESNNAALASMTYVGTTGYFYDGAQVHNRRHRLQLVLQGMESHSVSIGGIFGGSVSTTMPVTAVIEIQVEVFFDPALRRIALAMVDWTLTQAASQSYAAAVTMALRAKLDPLIWSSFELQTLPDTDAGAPIAVLSVKTLPNGTVSVFVEPHNNLAIGVGQLVNAVTPSVVLFSQPNN